MKERAIPILPMDDPKRAKEFYVDALGFHEVFAARYGSDGTIFGLERGEIRIHLDCPMSGHGRAACVCLEVADADAVYHQWKAKTPISDIPKNEEWGARTFTVIDPFGNSLFVVGPIK
jgi:uncharacterized glyoxalase superfamily protein PhnB